MKYSVEDLVTNDSNLVNPWAVITHNGEFWLTSNGKGKVVHYNLFGQKLPPNNITVPSASGLLGSTGNPTGLVWNETNGFKFSYNAQTPIKSMLITSTEDGQILGWNPAATSAFVKVYHSPQASYTGLAIVDNYIYATNFKSGKVDVFNNFFQIQNSYSFTDPNLPAGYKPFGIREHKGSLVITYALSSNGDDLKGPGYGIINLFNPLNGNLQRRLLGPTNFDNVSNAPFGLSDYSTNFAKNSKDSLIFSNSGDGKLYIINDVSGEITELKNENCNSIVIPGIKEITFLDDSLYFVAGGLSEDSGTFGVIERL